MKRYLINSVFGILLTFSLLTSCKKDVPSFDNPAKAVSNKKNDQTSTINKAASTFSEVPMSSAARGIGPAGILRPDTLKMGR